MRSIDHALISSDALRVLTVLRENGYAAYLVGGCVRDLLMGIPPKDFDITTDAKTGEIKKLFEKTIEVGARFGVIMPFSMDLPTIP